jgi:thiol-disulfide isomerase/thioredoxin
MSNKRRAKAAPARRPAGDPRRTWILGAIAATVIAVSIGIGVVAGGGGDDAEERTEIAAVDVTGSPLPAFGAGGEDPAVGMVAPVLEGVDFDGNRVTIGGGDTPTVVVAVAHWCPHCQRDLPVITDVLRDTDLEGVSVVALSSLASSERPNWPPSAWFDDVGWAADVLVDDADATAFQALGGAGTPFTVVLDAERRVVRRVSGEVGADGLRQLLEQARD